jgi:hypothetical protein
VIWYTKVAKSLILLRLPSPLPSMATVLKEINQMTVVAVAVAVAVEV